MELKLKTWSMRKMKINKRDFFAGVAMIIGNDIPDAFEYADAALEFSEEDNRVPQLQTRVSSLEEDNRVLKKENVKLRSQLKERGFIPVD